MCNTTCNNPSYIDDMNNIPENANIVYVLENDECECCKCNKSTCEEPKKVSCRSLACQQLNDECSCKKRKKTRKTTMVNVLENNVIRLEDKMNEGCANMHESIEEIVNNINVIYNALKDEEARAKLQEAFLHYGLDDAITRVWYNPEDRRMHFYHKNPANCLNVNVHEGCDCDCCEACGCECNCNNDECQSDIPYTMDEDCNIIPMSRDEEELFSIDCRDFIRDIFINSARLEYDYPNAVDGNLGEGPWLVISFKRTFESDLADDDENANPVEDLWIDLSKIWKLENYYDKKETRDEIRKVHITNQPVEVPLGDETVIAVLTYDNTIDGTPTVQPIKIKIKDLINTNNKANFGETTTIAAIGDDEIKIKMPGLELNDATLQYNQAVKYGNIDGTDVKITLPDDPLKRITNLTSNFTWNGSTNIAQYTLADGTTKYITVNAPANPADGLQDQIDNLGGDITNINSSIENINNAISNIDTNVPVENLDVTVPLGSNTATAFAKVKGQDIKIKIAKPAETVIDINVDNKNATLSPGSNGLKLATVDGKDITVNVPAAANYSATVTDNNATLTPGSNDIVLATIDGQNITVDVPAATSVSVVDNHPTLTPGTNNVIIGNVAGTNLTVDVPSANDVSVVANNPALSYGTESTIGSINGTPLKVTMPAAPEVPEGGLTYAITNVQGNNDNNGSTQLTITPSSGNPWTISLADQVGLTQAITNVQINQAGDTIIVTDSTGNTWNISLPQPGEGADGNDYVISGTVNNNNQLILTRKDGGTVTVDLPTYTEYQGDPFTGASQSGNTITFTRDSNTNPFSFNVVSNTNVTYGGDTVSLQDAITSIENRLNALEGLWKRTANNDGLEPVTANSKVYGAGFYDQTVS